MSDAIKFKPLNTVYCGYHFRSRLEARWAVLLEHLGVRWAYEPQGFNLGDGLLYLPDFWIRMTDDRQKPYPQGLPPERGFWLEIKPTEPDSPALEKCARLSKLTGHCVYLAAGNIGPGEYSVHKWHPNSADRGPMKCGTTPDDEIDFLVSYLSEACPEIARWNTFEDSFQAARSARF